MVAWRERWTPLCGDVAFDFDWPDPVSCLTKLLLGEDGGPNTSGAGSDSTAGLPES